jgi:hypothetical protein
LRALHGKAKTWHGLARAVRRGLANTKIQAYLTAAAINLKRLAAALLAFFARWMRTTPDPRVHFMRNVLAHAGRPGGREIAFLT